MAQNKGAGTLKKRGQGGLKKKLPVRERDLLHYMKSKKELEKGLGKSELEKVLTGTRIMPKSTKGHGGDWLGIERAVTRRSDLACKNKRNK